MNSEQTSREQVTVTVTVTSGRERECVLKELKCLQAVHCSVQIRFQVPAGPMHRVTLSLSTLSDFVDFAVLSYRSMGTSAVSCNKKR